LCEIKGIRWDYDALTRSFELNGASHRIKLHVGAKTVYVDGSVRDLTDPVRFHRGMAVVPLQFRQQIIESLFTIPRPEEKEFCFYRIRKVIIDPGHGGHDPGAIGPNGTREKDVVLEISKRLAELLRRYGVEVVMTRTSDKFIPLEKRAAMTVRSGADLFVSVHANANTTRSLNGFEVYYVKPKISDSLRAQTSAKTQPLAFGKENLGSSDVTLKAILWDLTHTYNRREAVQLSEDVCSAVGCKTDARIIGVKGANFCVLRDSTIPAVLVEVGFLSNYREERLLKDPAYWQKIAEGLVQGVANYARRFAHERAAQSQQYSFVKTDRVAE
jgi:N-acetylmuramoyl-L-alanine amidase